MGNSLSRSSQEYKEARNVLSALVKVLDDERGVSQRQINATLGRAAVPIGPVPELSKPEFIVILRNLDSSHDDIKSTTDSENSEGMVGTATLFRSPIIAQYVFNLVYPRYISTLQVHVPTASTEGPAVLGLHHYFFKIATSIAPLPQIL